MDRFLKNGNAWVVLAVVMAVAFWATIGWMWTTGILTLENVLVVPTALWVFFLGMFSVMLAVYLLWTTIGEPIVRIVRLRPRQHGA